MSLTTEMKCKQKHYDEINSFLFSRGIKYENKRHLIRQFFFDFIRNTEPAFVFVNFYLNTKITKTQSIAKNQSKYLFELPKFLNNKIKIVNWRLKILNHILINYA